MRRSTTSRLFGGALTLAALAFGGVSPTQAAQNGVVVVETAEVRRAPNEQSEVLAHLAKGAVVRMSSKDKLGWFQVEVPNATGEARFGWVLSTAVERESLLEDLKDAGITTGQAIQRDSARRLIVFRGFYGFHWYLSDSFRSLSGARLRQTELGAELGYRLWTTWTVLAHYSPLQILATAGSTSSEARGPWLALLVEHRLVQRPRWKADIALGPGALSSARLSTTSSTRSLSTPPTTLYGGLGRVALRWDVYENLSLAIEGGARYIPPKTITLPIGTALFDLSSMFASASLGLDL